MIAEHERVVLLTDLAEQGLERGDLGVVVHVYRMPWPTLPAAGELEEEAERLFEK